MKETPVSTSEKKFVLEALKQNLRLDGRRLNESRSMIISFGSTFGSAHVTLGQTRVLAQVSCELGQSQTTRPNEGILYINVELGPMAAQNFEPGRNSDLTVRINRILERTFKDSKCVDLESLCVIAEDRVWILRVDINVLNHEGNLIDCCAAACLAALAHFKRPDVTVDGTEVKIHTAAEKDFIPINLHHYPVCVSYAIFNDGKTAVVDPTLLEERICDADMVFGLNSYKELCCLNLSGKTLTASNLLLQCANNAADHARATVDLVKYEIECDADSRKRNEHVGFAECLKDKKLDTVSEEKLSLRIKRFHYQMPYFDRSKQIKEEEPNEGEIIDDNMEGNVKVEIDDSTGKITSNQSNIKWLPESESDDDDVDMSRDLGSCQNYESESDEKNFEDEVEELSKIKGKKNKFSSKKPKVKEEFSSDQDSEEEETRMLE